MYKKPQCCCFFFLMRCTQNKSSASSNLHYSDTKKKKSSLTTVADELGIEYWQHTDGDQQQKADTRLTSNPCRKGPAGGGGRAEKHLITPAEIFNSDLKGYFAINAGPPVTSQPFFVFLSLSFTPLPPSRFFCRSCFFFFGQFLAFRRRHASLSAAV